MPIGEVTFDRERVLTIADSGTIAPPNEIIVEPVDVIRERYPDGSELNYYYAEDGTVNYVSPGRQVYRFRNGYFTPMERTYASIDDFVQNAVQNERIIRELENSRAEWAKQLEFSGFTEWFANPDILSDDIQEDIEPCTTEELRDFLGYKG